MFQLIINFSWIDVLLTIVFIIRLSFGIVHCWLSSGNWVSGFLSLGVLKIFLSFRFTSNQENLTGSFFLNNLILLFAVWTLVLTKSIKKLRKFGKKLNWCWCWLGNLVFSLFSKFDILIFYFIDSLDFSFACSYLLLMFFLDPFRLRLLLKLIEFFLFIICIYLVKIIGFFNFVFSEEKQNDPVVLFDLWLDSESMTVKAVHF